MKTQFLEMMTLARHGTGDLIAFQKMDNTATATVEVSRAKARTAASSRVQTGNVHADVEIKLAVATGGKLTNLKGGVPILIDGQVVGAIGVGSGTGEQDREVALAGVAAGADGVHIEVHDCPEKAKSDGPQALLPKQYAELAEQIRKLAELFGRRISPAPGVKS